VTQKTKTVVLLIGFFTYVVLGMPSGLLGVAWPSIRTSFALPLSAMGTLLTTMTIGYIVSSFSTGWLLARLGAPRLLMIGCLLIGAGVLGYILAPAWLVMVACGVLLGLGNGVVDGGLNVYVAENYEARHMNWLHAFFGIGVTIGPIIMTATLNRGWVWQWGYLPVLLPVALLAIAYWLTRSWWQGSEAGTTAASPNRPIARASSRRSLLLPVVWLGMLVFLLHPGVEFIAGQWTYTLFTEGRAIDTTLASRWISIYWASLTVGRIVLGPVADRIGVNRLLRLCMLGIMAGAALLWWNPTVLVSFLGLAVIGFGVAPLYPSMMSAAPGWMGRAHAANAIGFMVAAGSAGVALLPGLVGVLADRVGLEVVGPFTIVATLIMLVLFQVLLRQSSASASSGIGAPNGAA
jgi:fucose permease